MRTDNALRRLALARRYLEAGDRATATDTLYQLVAELREDAVREPDAVSKERVRMVMENDFAERRGAEHVSKPIERVLVEMAGRVED